MSSTVGSAARWLTVGVARYFLLSLLTLGLIGLWKGEYVAGGIILVVPSLWILSLIARRRWRTESA